MDSFIRYPKIRRVNDWFLGETAVGYEDINGMFTHPNDILIIQEKIDGANFRFMITENEDLIFGTRNKVIHNETEQSIKSFQRAIQYVRLMVGKYILAGKDLSKFYRKIFFAEGCWKHSLGYDWDNMPIILGFDIWDIEAEEFLPYELVDTYYCDLGIPTVPLVMKAPVAAFTEPFTDLPKRN